MLVLAHRHGPLYSLSVLVFSPDLRRVLFDPAFQKLFQHGSNRRALQSSFGLYTAMQIFWQADGCLVFIHNLLCMVSLLYILPYHTAFRGRCQVLAGRCRGYSIVKVLGALLAFDSLA